MHIVFLDEFGHIGPFVSRGDKKHNTSPVFGLSGYMLPVSNVREFATWFHQLKCRTFENDIAASKHHPATWEKKGNTLFTHGRSYKTKRLMFSLINRIKQDRGRLFFHGVQKHESPDDSNAVGLYYTVLSHTIRNLDRLFGQIGDQYLVILDEHQSRLVLLESALRTMYGEHPARRLVQAPFQAESHLYPTLQAADWISSIIGPLWTYRAMPAEFEDRKWAETYFGARVAGALGNHSQVRLRKPKTQKKLF